MNLFQFYVIVANDLFALIFIVRFIIFVSQFSRRHVSSFFFQNLMYIFFVQRHKLLNSWTRYNVVLQIFYWVCIIFCIIFRVYFLTNVDIKASTLTIVNIILLYCTTYFNFFVDILKITLFSSFELHDSIGVMTSNLTFVHILINVLKSQHFNLQHFERIYNLLMRD